MTGRTISVIADTDDGAGGKTASPPAFREPYPVGFTHDATQVVIFKPGAVELWDVDPARLQLPEPARSGTFASFAFSPDNRWLAVGHDEGLWLFDRTTREWVRGIAGDHMRNRALAPMRFTADSTRLIALGDQLQISAYERSTGSRIGRLDTIVENWEGEVKIAADGSRIVVYRFLSDTFEVLDGMTAKRLGWVCPYFCNVMHNPVQPPYAVSPDGRSVAISHRRGAAVWDTATDQIRFPLRDPKGKPLQR